MKEIYDPKFVEELFDRMSGSYERMNYITSFGFSKAWRKQCVSAIDLKDKKVIVDLMTGMGECWKPILKRAGLKTKLISLDFSTEMLKYAANRKRKFSNFDIQILNENVFNNSIPTESVDCVISGFGLKTFSSEQIENLALEIERLLKVNGEFSLIDVSVPKSKTLRFFYLFYLKKIIPILGRIFLGNPETYKMLGIYTEQFQNSKEVKAIFEKRNFKIEYLNYFMGCATGIKGKKLLPTQAKN